MLVLGRSVAPCNKYGLLDFLTRARDVWRPTGGSPDLSVGLPGASGDLPEAPGTQDKPKQKHRNLKESIEQWNINTHRESSMKKLYK